MVGEEDEGFEGGGIIGELSETSVGYNENLGDRKGREIGLGVRWKIVQSMFWLRVKKSSCLFSNIFFSLFIRNKTILFLLKPLLELPLFT